jgi:hypothetical protein
MKVASNKSRFNSVMTLAQCCPEILNDAVSDTTDVDSSSERWQYNYQLYFKELLKIEVN